MSSTTNPNQFRVAHAIGNTYQVVRDQWAAIGRTEIEVVSTHDGREAAQRECERRNRTAKDSRKVIR